MTLHPDAFLDEVDLSAEKKCLDGCTVKYLDTVQVITRYFSTHGQDLMMKQQEIMQSRMS